MIKWHINLKERTGIMKKENSGFPEPFFKDKGEAGLKENELKRSKNYAAIASMNRKHYKLVRKHEMLISLLAVSHFLYTILMAGFYNINPFVSFEGALFAVVPSVIIAALFLELILPNIGVAEDVDKARNLLLETGQEVTYENINLIVGKYINEKKENGWNRIDDMLYEDRKVPAENVRNISGNSAAGKLNQDLKERGEPMKIDYVAKSRTQSNGTLILANLFGTMYIWYSCWVMLQITGEDGRVTVFFFLITFLFQVMFKSVADSCKKL